MLMRVLIKFTTASLLILTSASASYAGSKPYVYHFEQDGFSVEMMSASYGSAEELEELASGVSADILKDRQANPGAEYYLETASEDFNNDRGPSQVGEQPTGPKKFMSRLGELLGRNKIQADQSARLNLDEAPSKAQQIIKKYGVRTVVTVIKAVVTGELVYHMTLAEPATAEAATWIAGPAFAALVLTGAVSNFLSDFSNAPKYRLARIEKGLKAVGEKQGSMLQNFLKRYDRSLAKIIGKDTVAKAVEKVKDMGSATWVNAQHGVLNFLAVEYAFNLILIEPQGWIHHKFAMPYHGASPLAILGNSMLATAVQQPYEAALYKFYSAVLAEGKKTPEQMVNFRSPWSAAASIACSFAAAALGADSVTAKVIGGVTLLGVRITAYGLDKYVDKKYGSFKNPAKEIFEGAIPLQCDRDLGGNRIEQILKLNSSKAEGEACLWLKSNSRYAAHGVVAR